MTQTPAPSLRTVTLPGDVPLNLSESGSGRPALILHGGGGPTTVESVAAHLAPAMHTLTPTHPGWNGTPRPETLAGVTDLARTYLTFLETEDLRDVLLIGSSVGGWIAAELALRDTAGRVGALVLIDAVGIEVEGQPIRDVFALDARGVAEYSYHDAERYMDPASLPAGVLALRGGNMAALRTFAGDPYMHDPALRKRLKEIRVPALVLWGESDRIVTPAYGQAFAEALGHARFEVIAQAGHLPQIEQPAATFVRLDAFVGSLS